MNAEQIVQIVSNVMTVVLALELLPGLREWWGNEVARKWKPLIILALCLLIPLGIMGLECAGYDARQDVTCDEPQSIPMWLTVISTGFSAFVISQVGYLTIARPLGDRLSGKEPTPSISVTTPVTINSAQTTVSDAGSVQNMTPPALSVDDLPLDTFTDDQLEALIARIGEIVHARRKFGPLG